MQHITLGASCGRKHVKNEKKINKLIQVNFKTLSQTPGGNKDNT